MDFLKIMNSGFLNNLKDYVQVEIKNPDQLMSEIQSRFVTKINPLASESEKLKLNERIDMTQYFDIHVTEKTKKLLMWGGIGLFLWFLLRRG